MVLEKIFLVKKFLCFHIFNPPKSLKSQNIIDFVIKIFDDGLIVFSSNLLVNTQSRLIPSVISLPKEFFKLKPVLSWSLIPI